MDHYHGVLYQYKDLRPRFEVALAMNLRVCSLLSVDFATPFRDFIRSSDAQESTPPEEANPIG